MCTGFVIIDDVIALEGEETFVIDVVPEEGRVDIGRNNRTVITIEDNDGKPIHQIIFELLFKHFCVC